MKIALVNTYDVQGGAARAAYRLHQGLQRSGHKSTLISRYKASSDSTVLQVESEVKEEFESVSQAIAFEAIYHTYIASNRSSLTNTFFSFPYPGFDLSNLAPVINSDIINLHWIANFQSPATLSQLLELGKPVIWTLHDMAAFTGGCHFSAGCQKYRKDCVDCPQLEHDPGHLIAAVLADKLQFFADKSITVVTPSHWLADCAKSSTLLKDQRIEVIPNGLDVDTFVPLPKAHAKEKIGVDPDVRTILFGAGTALEDRKGFPELVSALWRCLEDSRFRELADHQKICLLCFGEVGELLAALPISVRPFGTVGSDEELSVIYSAADFFVLPSLEDNLPNTMLEAMSCGTPVVGFDVGGIPDMVKDYVTGRLAPPRNSYKLAEVILDCIFDVESCHQMGQQGRQLVEENYSLAIQADRYLNLFENLLVSQPYSAASTDSVSSNQQQANEEIVMADSEMSIQQVPVNTTVGTHIGQSFEKTAFKAIATHLQQVKSDFHQSQTALQQAYADLQQTHTNLSKAYADLEQEHAARLDFEMQARRLQHDLEASKPARFQINEKIAENEQLKKRVNELIYQTQQQDQLIKQKQRRIQRIERKMKRKEERRSQRIKTLRQRIEALQGEVEYVKTAKGALKNVVKAALAKFRS